MHSHTSQPVEVSPEGPVDTTAVVKKLKRKFGKFGSGDGLVRKKISQESQEGDAEGQSVWDDDSSSPAKIIPPPHSLPHSKQVISDAAPALIACTTNARSSSSDSGGGFRNKCSTKKLKAPMPAGGDSGCHFNGSSSAGASEESSFTPPRNPPSLPSAAGAATPRRRPSTLASQTSFSRGSPPASKGKGKDKGKGKGKEVLDYVLPPKPISGVLASRLSAAEKLHIAYLVSKGNNSMASVGLTFGIDPATISKYVAAAQQGNFAGHEPRRPVPNAPIDNCEGMPADPWGGKIPNLSAKSLSEEERAFLAALVHMRRQSTPSVAKRYSLHTSYVGRIAKRYLPPA